MRWSSIDEQKGLRIYSWSPVDALQLVQQHWKKPQHTQGDTQEDVEAVNRSTAQTDIRHEPRLEVNIPSGGNKALSLSCSSCWGDPTTDQLMSSQAWSEFLGEMSHRTRVRTDCLTVKLDVSSTVCLKGLLDTLLLEDAPIKQLVMERDGGWRDVRIYTEKVNVKVLSEWSRQNQAQQSLIHLRLVTKG